MEFLYIALTPQGDTSRGSMEASAREEVLQRLRQQNLSVLSIVQQQSRMGERSLGTMSLQRISSLDKVVLIRHLAVMLRAGLPLVEALQTIREQSDSTKLQQILAAIIQDVSNGKPLADALARHERVFSSIVIGMIRIGEASGTLEENLDYVATELEKDYELRRKVRSALLYPSIVLSATVILGIGLSIFILPRLVQLFNTFRVDLPPVTRVFLNVATFLVAYGWYLLGALAILAVISRIAIRAPSVRQHVDRLYLHVPVISPLVQNAQLARITRILSILLKSGITINETLAITAKAIDNAVYRQQLLHAHVGVQKGQTLATMFGDDRYFPKMVNRMVGVGERTGKLDESLGYLATFYEDAVDHATKNLSTVLEPALLIFIGVVLGFLAVAIISPIYQLTGSLQP